MKRYNQQIEDAYVGSRRQGDMMRDRDIERSSGQDRTNRYRDDRYQYSQEYRPFDRQNQGSEDRVDRYGYERARLYSSDQAYRERLDDMRRSYPETYRSAMSGYMSEHVGSDKGRRDYYPPNNEGNLYGTRYGLHRGKGPRNYVRSDERIREDILDKLTDDPYIDASEIEVTVQSGEVTLMGLVNERSDKRHAEDIAESVSGVKYVENRLKAQPGSDNNKRSQDRLSEIEIPSPATLK
jgi:osmotically-inducible protein OsmY